MDNTLAWIYLNGSVKVKHYVTLPEEKDEALNIYLGVVNTKAIIKTMELDEII